MFRFETEGAMMKTSSAPSRAISTALIAILDPKSGDIVLHL
jgi:hypothetical protein